MQHTDQPNQTRTAENQLKFSPKCGSISIKSGRRKNQRRQIVKGTPLIFTKGKMTLGPNFCYKYESGLYAPYVSASLSYWLNKTNLNNKMYSVGQFLDRQHIHRIPYNIDIITIIQAFNRISRSGATQTINNRPEWWWTISKLAGVWG